MEVCMKLKLIPFFLLLGVMAFSTSFNYSSALVNAPDAQVLSSMGYYIAINHSQSFSKDLYDPREVGEEDLNLNFAYHVPMEGIFKLNFEAGLTVYSMFSTLEGQNLLAGNVKLQIIQDPTDKDYGQKYDFDKSPIYKLLPSVALGVRNITGEKYATSIGTIPPYFDADGNEMSAGADNYDTDHSYSNSFYLAMSKKFYMGNMFIQGHLGYGMGMFQGIKSVDRNVGVVYGVSTTIFPINKLSPLRIMFDYDGNKYSVGAQLIYNNPQLLNIASTDSARKFIPGFVFNLAVTDIDEAIHSYGDTGWSPKVEFGLGITNNAYLTFGGKGTPSKRVVKKKKAPKKKVIKKKKTPKKKIVKKAPKKKVVKKKMTTEEARAMARKRAMAARRKAEEARKRAMSASTGKTAAAPKVTKATVESAFSDSVKRSLNFIEEDGTVKFIPRTVRFKMGSTDLLPIAYKALDEIGSFLKKNLNVKVEIQGHTDTSGNAANNLKLSDSRANAIKNYLVKKFGIVASRLVAKGYGPSKPRYDNKTPIGRAKNRRIEFVILK